ncbi:alpha/beta hydrolase family protein [Streptomyces sp. O3]
MCAGPGDRDPGTPHRVSRTRPRTGGGLTVRREPAEDTALELLVHGVGGATAEGMLGDPRTVRVTGDKTAAVFRRAEDADAEQRPEDYTDTPVREAYVWSNLTSGNGARALWLLLLPFMVVNLAHWMRPHTRGLRRTTRFYGVLVRLVGLTLTVLLVAAACEVALDLVAWQCAGTPECTADRSWLGFLAADASGQGGWWAQPGRRLALATAVPAALTGLLWYLSHRTWSAYESQQPLPHHREPDEDPRRSALSRPGFWYGRRLVARLRAAHTAAGLLTCAAAVSTAAARFDRRPGGPLALDVIGRLMVTTLVAGALVVVWVVCRRGRSEDRVDQRVDRAATRLLPGAALAVLALAVVYAGWDRPGWTSAARLPGDATFGGIALVQGLLTVALAVVAAVLYRGAPGPRTALRGLAGPAVAMLGCALGGVMSGGVAQWVGDWLDSGGTPGEPGRPFPGPPALLTWQASVIPVVLAVVVLLALILAVRALRRGRAEIPRVARDYPDESPDPARTRRIAGARARAALTDHAPTVAGIVSAATLLLGAAALLGAWSTGEVPGEAARDAAPFVQGAAQTAQALGSWLIGLGFLLLVTWGRRAYRDPAARRTIGILWDVGTFWPRAAHPFAPPCYAERAVPDLTWRMATWTREPGRRLVISGHSQGSVLAAAAAWQLSPSVRRRVAVLTYGSPLERLYGRWFPAHFGPAALAALHHEVDCWRNLYRPTDPIGGPIGLPGDCGRDVDHPPLKDPLVYGRTASQPLPAPILGHSDYQADPVFDAERTALFTRLRGTAAAGKPLPRQPGTAPERSQGSSGRSSG